MASRGGSQKPGAVPLLIWLLSDSTLTLSSGTPQSAPHQTEDKPQVALGCQGTDGHRAVGSGAGGCVTAQKPSFLYSGFYVFVSPLMQTGLPELPRPPPSLSGAQPSGPPVNQVLARNQES